MTNKLLAIIVATLLFITSARAQSATASLGGVVTDEQGAVVPGATVTIENGAKAIARQAETNGEGFFTFTQITPSTYTVKAQGNGFTAAELVGVVLNVNDQRSLRIQLKVAGVGETVDVNDSALLIGESPAVSTVVDRRLGVNLRVRAGEIVGIYGPSGCGKSTMLRLPAALELPTTGSVTMAGVLTTKEGSTRLLNPLARRGFVMPIFQDPVGSLDRRWPVWRTITEPLAAAHRARRPPRAARRVLARRVMDEIGLQDVDPDARPGELSVGQCQRVSIARAGDRARPDRGRRTDFGPRRHHGGERLTSARRRRAKRNRRRDRQS
ncbi:MAG TPA: ATP-binding cassette domain-containing protein [Pyrinomonadaceae bacterium]|nr:ATP-binding cassette domain-containing protein [Pyrinomonadaceae bacterium]